MRAREKTHEAGGKIGKIEELEIWGGGERAVAGLIRGSKYFNVESSKSRP